MIFFTDKGEVKVWIHPNLSSFQPNYHPEYYNANNQTKGCQSEMVKGLINIIERNSDRPFPANPSFRNYLQQFHLHNKLTFAETIDHL